MCGIAGAIWTDPDLAVSDDTLLRMTNVLAHRGPDDSGTYLRPHQARPPYEPLPGIALGHRRLSIIDVAHGKQPLANEDHTVWIAYNGEVYNFPELRKRLEGSGHTFRTNCDTEVIVHLYEDEGTDCFRHLNGMFGIAIWDSHRRRLVLGRDRLGQKPVVYRREAGRLLFASELKSILEVPGVPRDIDPTAIDEYLTYQYIPHPNTIFRGIHKLPPGHYAVFQDDTFEVQPYWEPQLDGERAISSADAVDKLRELFASAVKIRLQSDVPLGAFLSGGIDSSLVVAQMQRLREEPIKTFTIGFPNADYDETKYARQVARFPGTDHQEFQVTPDAVGIVEKLAWHYDEPFADSSAMPTWYLSEMTKQHVTVALSGDGGDELFAGYKRYHAAALAARMDRIPLVGKVFGAKIWQSLPSPARQKSLLRQAKRYSEALRTAPARRYLNWVGLFSESQRAVLYQEDFIAHLTSSDPFHFLGTAWQRVQGRDPATVASLTDLMTYLPCDLMTKVDIASMAHGLECRQPMLDYRLVEFAISLPGHLKYRLFDGKRVLRTAFRETIPKEIWKRPKMGFGVPVEHWFRNELKPLTQDVLLSPQAKCLDYFRGESIQQLVSQHENHHFDHSYRLWSLLMFELWLRQWS